MTHRFFMEKALLLAQQAACEGEIPVGAVVVKNGQIIGKGYNTKEKENCALNHAEINAIRDACKNLNSWRLDGCTLYVNLEPCPMCAGAVLNSRIKTVVYSLDDFKGGGLGGLVNLNNIGFNHTVEIIAGVMEDESRIILKDYFSNLRNKK